MGGNFSSSVNGFYNKITLIIVVVLIFVVLAMQAAINLANSEFDRDVRNWEIKLGIVADTRYLAVQNWVDQQFNEMQGIAENMTVELFMTEHDLKEKNTQFSQEEEGRLGFIRNYLTATAQRAGFATEVLLGDVRANIYEQGNAGIILLDNNKNIIAITQGTPNILSEEGDFVDRVWSSKKALKDIFITKNGEILIAFSAPIFAIQGQADGSQKQIGAVIGVRTVEELYSLLKKPDLIEKTAETILVRHHGGVIEYISPLSDGSKALQLKLNQNENKAELAAGYALNNNKFTILNDYSSQEVLSTSRKISGTPWVMIHKINSDEALAETIQRKNSIIVIGVLATLLLLIVVIAVWRHGSSIRYKKLAEKFRSQERLLRLVSDNMPDAMYILDDSNHYCFANLSTSNSFNMNNDDMFGKTIRSVAGAVKADHCQAITKRVSSSGAVVTHIQHDLDDGGNMEVIQSKYIHLDRVPRILTGEVTSGVLVVEQDITQAILEKEKRERLLNALVDTLVAVVDGRDHFSADHSIKVAQIATAIAKEMNLDKNLIETVEIAAKLMNLGKIIMPRELLNKKGKFTSKDRKLIADARKASADFVANLEFNGPVEGTLRQVQERWDGCGELGLAGEKSLVTARIVAISNEYIAMTSQRAYRGAITEEESLSIMMGEIGKKYERKLVVALVSLIENNKQNLDG